MGAQAPEPAALASRPLEAEPGRARLPRPHPAEAAAPAGRPAPPEALGADRLESEPPRLARLAAAAPAARQTRAGALPQPLPVPDTAPPAAHGDLAVPPAAAAPATAPDRVVAPPATPAAEKLASTPPGATQLDTAEPAPDPAQAGAPDTLVLVAAPARPTGLSPARPDAAPLASGALRPAALAPENPAARPTPAALPDTPHITPAAPTAAPATQGEAPTANIAPTTADPVPLAAAAPAPAPAAEGVAPVDRQRATTALDGFGDIADPVSLTAMQSFMAPETLAPEADIRDGLAGMLAGVPCARLQARFLPERGMLEVHGHVPEEDAAAPLLAALRAEMGADIPVRPNLRVLPRPQCEVLSTIAETGLPQSTDQALDARLVGEDTHVKEFTFAEGDPLVLELAAPDYDAYLYVDYFDAAGQVIHLMPNEATPLRRAEAGSLQKIGAAGPDGPGLRLLIGPPFGQEIAVAFAASTPLYEGARPMVEPAAPYLASLTRLIAQARARDPDFRGEWVYFLVVTRPS